MEIEKKEEEEEAIDIFCMEATSSSISVEDKVG
jgi:hypothetical protein